MGIVFWILVIGSILLLRLLLSTPKEEVGAVFTMAGNNGSGTMYIFPNRVLIKTRGIFSGEEKTILFKAITNIELSSRSISFYTSGKTVRFQSHYVKMEKKKRNSRLYIK